MCSLFGFNEKLEFKLEEIVKKFEDRLADIEDKQDNDYENNKSKFDFLEDKIDSLNQLLEEQQKQHSRND